MLTLHAIFYKHESAPFPNERCSDFDFVVRMRGRRNNGVQLEFKNAQADYSACGVCSASALSCGAGYKTRNVIQGPMDAMVQTMSSTDQQVGYCQSSSVPFTQGQDNEQAGEKVLADASMVAKIMADVSMAAKGIIGVASATSTTATGPSSVCDPKVDGTADQKADHALCCEAIKITS